MPPDSTKTKTQLIKELNTLRKTTVELSKNPAFAHFLFEKATDPILLAHASTGIIVDCNQAAEDFLGYPRDQIIGMHQRELHPPEAIDGELPISLMEHCDNPDKWIEVPILTASGKIQTARIKTHKTNIDSEPLIMGIFHDISGPKKVERKLRTIQKRFRTMFTHLSSGVAVYEAVDNGADFIFKDFNPAAEKITRISREKTIGQRLLTLFPHMDKSGLLAALTRVWKTGEAEDLPPFHYKDDVREGWRENHIYKLPSGEVIALFNDVTERMEALNALQINEQRMKLALESVNDAVWDWNIQTGEVYFSSRWYTMLGYEVGELPTEFKTWEDLLHPNDHDQTKALVLRHLEKGGDFQHEFRMQTKKGDWRWIFARGRTVETDDKGRAARMIGTHVDITERKQIEAALKASEQRFRALLEDVDMVAVQGYDANRRVVYWNRASEKLYGYTSEEAMGEYLEELILPDFMRADVIQFINNWFTNGVPIPPGELDLVGKDGSPVPVYSSHVMQEETDGTKTIYCIDVELSRIRQAYDQLRLAKEEAETANHAKSEFLANMSHEIRTPLNGVLGMLQLLQTTPLNNEQKSYVDNATTSSKRLTRLLSDILDLSRVEAGRMPLANEPLSLPQTMQQLEELFLPIVQQSQLKLTCHVHPATREQMIGDSIRLHQVLSNLVGNAFKFTQKGSILVETYPLPSPRPNTAKVLFSVSDTGIGIPDDKLDTLFQPFIQGSTGRTRSHQGAGLGLAISKRIVDLMDGNMAVKSEFGVGTTVYFCATFDTPKPDQPTHSEAPTNTTDFALILKKLRILLAEDEPVNSLIAAKMLKKTEADVTVVRNGYEVLKALSQNNFDIILMDIQMPIMSGLEATKTIRAGGKNIQKDIPIIAMTAYAMDGNKKAFLDAGMDGYLAKPIENDELCATICATIKKKTNR